MKPHFSDEEFDAWTLGERPGPLREHAALCPECRCRANEWQNVLTSFRRHARDLAASPEAAVSLPAARSRQPAWIPWFPTLAALLLLAAFFGFQHVAARRAAEREQIVRRSADAALLDQVDAGISRALPAPMEPLLGLVSWNDHSGDR